MRRTPGLLAVDLDGTLLSREGIPHEADVRAIRRLSEEGVPITILTGRLLGGTRAAAEALQICGPVGVADGSHIVDVRDHATLHHAGIAGEARVELRQALGFAAGASFLLTKDAIVHDARGGAHREYISLWSTNVQETHDVCEHPSWELDEGLTAVVHLGLEREITRMAAQIREWVYCATFPLRRGGLFGLVARAKDSTKGTALQKIAAHHGIPIADTVVVGDWHNDVPMFEVAGRSFCMGQAPDAVKNRASDVLSETVDSGGGIATAIRIAFDRSGE